MALVYPGRHGASDGCLDSPPNSGERALSATLASWGGAGLHITRLK